MRKQPLNPSPGFPAALLLLLCLLAPPDFAAARPKMRLERSQPEPPLWTSRVPEADKDYLYYVGRASGGKSIEDSESDAAANALAQIVTTLGVRASLSYERLRREAGLLLEDRLTLLGESRVIGLKRLESYYEKQIVMEGDSVKTSYNSQILVRYPRQALETELARMEQEAAGRVQQAEQWLAASLDLEKSGDLESAFARLLEALELSAKPAVQASEPVSRRLELCRSRLLEAARRLSLHLRKVAVETVALGGDSAVNQNRDRLLTESLEQALLSQGFYPEKGELLLSLQVLPRVSASCREEGASDLEAGFCFSRWTASIQILDPRDDSLLLAAVYSAKGFGPDLQRAGLDALRKLRIEIFNKFARDARDKFDLSFAARQ